MGLALWDSLRSVVFGSTGVGGNRIGGEHTAANEWVLKPSTKYVGKLTNGSSGSNDVSIQMLWYEEQG